MFNGSRVQVAPGTLYAAPLGTTEPTSVTGQWPANWVLLGYTDTGSEFDLQPTVQEVTVEEEYWPIREAVMAYKGNMTFALAERTAQNLQVVLNNGIGSALNAQNQGTNPDSSIWVEPPDPGNEQRIMLGWDALSKGGTSGNAFGRIIARQVIQTGDIKETHRKGSNKSTWPATFTLEYPTTGLRPVRFIFPPALAS